MGPTSVLRGLIRQPDEPAADEAAADGYLFDSERTDDDEEMTWLERWQEYARWWEKPSRAASPPPGQS